MKKALLSVLAILVISNLVFADIDSNQISATSKQINKTVKAAGNQDVNADADSSMSLPPGPPAPPASAKKQQVKDSNDMVKEQEKKAEVDNQPPADPNVKKVKAPDQNKKIIRLWMKNANDDQLTLLEEVYSNQIEELEKIKKQAELDGAKETVQAIDEMVDAKTKEQDMLTKKLEARVETVDVAAEKKERAIKARKQAASKSSQKSSSEGSSDSTPPSSSGYETKKKTKPPVRKPRTPAEE